MSKLVWTKKRPKKEGYYWERIAQGTETILWINPKSQLTSHYKGVEWAGPIPFPSKPKPNKKWQEPLCLYQTIKRQHRKVTGKPCICISDVHLGDFMEKAIRDRQARRIRGMP